MMVGAFRYRLPPVGWQPDGYVPPSETKSMITKHEVHLDNAHKTPQFWLIWGVLCLNVSAGIGVIGMASPMLQEIFGGKLIGHPELGFNALSADQKVAISDASPPALSDCCRCSISAAACSGRRCPTISGARTPIICFFILGIVLYASAPTFALMGSKALFVLRLRHHPVDVWRRLRHRAGLSRRHVRHAVRRRHSRPPADGVVDGGHRRPGGGELHPRIRSSPPACRATTSTTTPCISSARC